MGSDESGGRLFQLKRAVLLLLAILPFAFGVSSLGAIEGILGIPLAFVGTVVTLALIDRVPE